MKRFGAFLLALFLALGLGGTVLAQGDGAAADEQKAREALEAALASAGLQLDVNLQGFLAVVKVDPKGKAETAGLRAGDVLVSSNGTEITDLPAFLNSMLGAEKARPASVRIVRDGKVLRLRAGPGCGGDCGEGCKCGGDCKGKCGGGCKCGGDCKGGEGCKCGGKDGQGCKCGGKCGDGCGCGGKCEGGCKGAEGAKCGGQCGGADKGGEGCKGGCGGKCGGQAKPAEKPADAGAAPLAKIAELLGLATVAFDDGAAQVKEVAKDREGTKIGLAAGDVILLVDGKDVGRRRPMESILAAAKDRPEFVVLRGKEVLRLRAAPVEEKPAEGKSGCGGCGTSG